MAALLRLRQRQRHFVTTLPVLVLAFSTQYSSLLVSAQTSWQRGGHGVTPLTHIDAASSQQQQQYFFDPSLDLERAAQCLSNRNVVITGDKAAFALWAALGSLLEEGARRTYSASKPRFAHATNPLNERDACLGTHEGPHIQIRTAADDVRDGRNCEGTWCECDATVDVSKGRGDAAVRITYKQVGLLYDGRAVPVLEANDNLPDIFIPVVSIDGLAGIEKTDDAVAEVRRQAEKLSDAVRRYLELGDLNRQMHANKQLQELGKKSPRAALEQSNHRADPPLRPVPPVKLGNFTGHQRDRDQVVIGPTGDAMRLSRWKAPPVGYGGMAAMPERYSNDGYSWQRRERMRREEEERKFQEAQSHKEDDDRSAADRGGRYNGIPVIASITVYLPETLAAAENIGGQHALKHLQRKVLDQGVLCARGKEYGALEHRSRSCVPYADDAAPNRTAARMLSAVLVGLPSLRAEFHGARVDEAGREVVDIFATGTVAGMPPIPGQDEVVDSAAWEHVRIQGSQAIETAITRELGNAFRNERPCPCGDGDGVATKVDNATREAFCSAASADEGSSLGDPCRGLDAGTYATRDCRAWVRCDGKGGLEDEGECGSSLRFLPAAGGAPAGCQPSKLFAVALEPSEAHATVNATLAPPHPPPALPPTPPGHPGQEHAEACPETSPYQHHAKCWPADVADLKASHPPRVMLVEAGVPCVHEIEYNPHIRLKKKLNQHRKKVASGEATGGWDRRTMASRAARANEVAKAELKESRLAPVDRVKYVIDRVAQTYGGADPGHLESVPPEKAVGGEEASVRMLGGFGEANDLCKGDAGQVGMQSHEIAQKVLEAWARRLVEQVVKAECDL